MPAAAIVRDSSGHILLVDPTYKPDWALTVHAIA
jgi:hypothetical protein